MSGSNGFDLEGHKILYFTDALGVFISLVDYPILKILTVLTSFVL